MKTQLRETVSELRPHKHKARVPTTAHVIWY